MGAMGRFAGERIRLAAALRRVDLVFLRLVRSDWRKIR
jgi:hypothetical protein